MFSCGVKTYLVVIPVYHPIPPPPVWEPWKQSLKQNKPSKFCGLNGVQRVCRTVFLETAEGISNRESAMVAVQWISSQQWKGQNCSYSQQHEWIWNSTERKKPDTRSTLCVIPFIWSSRADNSMAWVREIGAVVARAGPGENSDCEGGQGPQGGAKRNGLCLHSGAGCIGCTSVTVHWTVHLIDVSLHVSNLSKFILKIKSQ